MSASVPNNQGAASERSTDPLNRRSKVFSALRDVLLFSVDGQTATVDCNFGAICSTARDLREQFEVLCDRAAIRRSGRQLVSFSLNTLHSLYLSDLYHSLQSALLPSGPDRRGQ